jgi:hypothetical protein
MCVEEPIGVVVLNDRFVSLDPESKQSNCKARDGVHSNGCLLKNVNHQGVPTRVPYLYTLTQLTRYIIASGARLLDYRIHILIEGNYHPLILLKFFMRLMNTLYYTLSDRKKQGKMKCILFNNLVLQRYDCTKLLTG